MHPQGDDRRDKIGKDWKKPVINVDVSCVINVAACLALEFHDESSDEMVSHTKSVDTKIWWEKLSILCLLRWIKKFLKYYAKKNSLKILQKERKKNWKYID